MHVDSFHRLHKLLHKHDANLKLRKRGCDVNGPITSTARLSMALRYFVGGDQVRYWVSPWSSHEPSLRVRVGNCGLS